MAKPQHQPEKLAISLTLRQSISLSLLACKSAGQPRITVATPIKTEFGTGTLEHHYQGTYTYMKHQYTNSGGTKPQ